MLPASVLFFIYILNMSNNSRAVFEYSPIQRRRIYKISPFRAEGAFLTKL